MQWCLTVFLQDKIELVCAAIVKTHEDAKITESDVIDLIKKSDLEKPYAINGGVLFLDELPRNRNGKIIRFKLKNMFQQS